jgi:hypothetical protein
LQNLRYINVVIAALEKHQKTAVDMTANAKQLALLDELWVNMRPGVMRRGPSDWGEIGFQGTDPSTDFRGLGLLGLHQLLHFSRHHPAEARQVLLVANHPRRYFPFAATGINISAFVLDMLRGRHLHEYLLQQLETHTRGDNTTGGQSGGNPADDRCPSESESLVEAGVRSVHEIYCEVYVRFCQVWEERDPPNVMSFKPIFADVQKEFRERYRAF